MPVLIGHRGIGGDSTPNAVLECESREPARLRWGCGS